MHGPIACIDLCLGKIGLNRRAQSYWQRSASFRREQFGCPAHQRWTLGALSQNDGGEAPIWIDNSDGHGLRKIAKLFGVFRVAPVSTGGKARHQNVRDDLPSPIAVSKRPLTKSETLISR